MTSRRSERERGLHELEGRVLADYSQTPLARKLGMRDGHVVYLTDAPAGFLGLLEPLPKVTVRRRLSGPVDVAIAFTTTKDQLSSAFDRLGGALTPSGGLWIAWPKRSSTILTELDFAAVQSSGLEARLVDNKSCSIDEDWQALRFVRRVRDRPSAPKRPDDGTQAS